MTYFDGVFEWDTEGAYHAHHDDPSTMRMEGSADAAVTVRVPWDRLFRNPATVYVLSCSACGRTSDYHGTPHPHYIRWCLCGAVDTTTATLKDNMP